MGKQIQCVFGLIFLLVLMSCENDLYNDTFRQKGLKIKLSAYSAKSADGLRNTNLNAEMAKLRDKGRLAGRPVYDSVYNIWFDDENGVKIEAGDYKSFTFPAKKEDSEQLINILFKELANGEYETMLVKYNISAEEFKTLPKENYPTLEPEFERVLYNDGYLTIEHFCEPTWQEQEGFYDDEGSNVGDEDQYPDGVPTQMVFIGLSCYYVYTFAGGGGNSNPNPPDNSENPGGNFGPGSPNVITTPLPEFETDLTPCEILKKTLGNGQPSVRDKLISLRPHTENDKEFGISFSFDGNSDHYENLDVAPKTSDGTNNVSLPTGEYFYGGAHAHHKDGISVPSFRDILWLYQCREASITYNRKKAVLFTVTKNMISSSPATITYVMMVEDYSELEDFLQDMLGDFSPEIPPNDKIEMIMERDANDYLDDYATMEEKFLQKYSEAGFGLYKMNDSLTAAERISLDVTGNVSSTPCP